MLNDLFTEHVTVVDSHQKYLFTSFGYYLIFNSANEQQYMLAEVVIIGEDS